MQDNSPEYYNASYKTDKLMDKLGGQFQGQIQFWQPNIGVSLSILAQSRKVKLKRQHLNWQRLMSVLLKTAMMLQ